MPGVAVIYPDSYVSADMQARTYQRMFLRLTVSRLTLLIVSAVGGALQLRFGEFNIAGLVAVVGLTGAMLVELTIRSRSPEAYWYSGRALAESVKTLTWRFISGGNPFPKSLSTDEASALFLSRIRDVRSDLRNLLVFEASTGGREINQSLVEIRGGSLARRKEIYRNFRIGDQKEWYSSRARSHRRAAENWSTGLLIVEIVGVAGGILRAMSVLDFDLLGVVSAVVAGIVAWVQSRQHQSLASAYAVASHELADIDAQVDMVIAEQDWANFVANAEDAVSREHTTWRASQRLL